MQSAGAQNESRTTAEPTRRGWPPVVFLFVAVGLLGITGAVFETTLNNYLHDTFGLTAGERGRLEFPRELPGFLTAVFAGALLFLPEARVAVVAVVVLATGLFGLAQVDIGYWHMLSWLVVWSCGMHLFMPLEASLAIQASREGRTGTRLGQMGFVRTAGHLVGSLFVWQALQSFSNQYRMAFLAAGVGAVFAALALLFMPRLAQGARQPTRFVFKRRYALFYTMCVLFGARKQVFITFAPWVLVKVFEQPPQVIGKLWFAAGLFGLAFKPLLGRLIDRVGERAVLVADGIVLAIICLGYGFAESLFPRTTALHVLYGCFVIDNLMFAVGMARHTYMSKIAEAPQDVTPTFSFGVTLNHAVSMTVPCLGGLLWAAQGYPAVFIAAAGVAVLTTVAASFVRVGSTATPQEGVE